MSFARSLYCFALIAAVAGCPRDNEGPDHSCVAGARVCEDLDLVVPAPRGETVGVWDGDRNRMVLFGGDEGPPVDCSSRPDFAGETWAFLTECDAFVLIAADDAPRARGRHIAALDLDGERMIIQGGRRRATGADSTADYTMLNDTWFLDLTSDTWTEADASGGPSGRANHVGVVAGGRLIVHGGDSSRAPLGYVANDDVWALDLDSQRWEELATTNGPSPRLFHAGATDGQTLYIYGGTGADPFFTPAFGDLWALDLDSLEWEMLHDGRGDAPDDPFWANLMFDDTEDRLLLWAGHDAGTLGSGNQIWEFDLDAGDWGRLERGDELDNTDAGFCDFPPDFTEPDLDAPERRNAAAAGITSCGEIVTFGGKTDCGLINDVWAWSPDDGWDERSSATSGEICLRAFAECETLCF
jgi:hypothetical protein